MTMPQIFEHKRIKWMDRMIFLVLLAYKAPVIRSTQTCFFWRLKSTAKRRAIKIGFYLICRIFIFSSYLNGAALATWPNRIICMLGEQSTSSNRHRFKPTHLFALIDCKDKVLVCSNDAESRTWAVLPSDTNESQKLPKQQDWHKTWPVHACIVATARTHIKPLYCNMIERLLPILHSNCNVSPKYQMEHFSCHRI